MKDINALKQSREELQNSCQKLRTYHTIRDYISFIYWASTRENLSSVFANNKGVDQPAHPRNLISAFVIRLL